MTQQTQIKSLNNMLEGNVQRKVGKVVKNMKHKIMEIRLRANYTDVSLITTANIDQTQIIMKK